MDISRGTLPTVHMETRLKEIMETSPYLKDHKKLEKRLLTEEFELWLWIIHDEVGEEAFSILLESIIDATTEVRNGLPEVVAVEAGGEGAQEVKKQCKYTADDTIYKFVRYINSV